MVIYRISRPADIALLREKTGLENLPWATGFPSVRFVNWLVARGTTLDLDHSKLVELTAAIETEHDDDDIDALNTRDVDGAVDRLQREETTIVRAVQQIRSGDCGEQVMRVLADLATTPSCEQIVMRLNEGLLRRLMTALALLE